MANKNIIKILLLLLLLCGCTETSTNPSKALSTPSMTVPESKIDEHSSAAKYDASSSQNTDINISTNQAAQLKPKASTSTNEAVASKQKPLKTQTDMSVLSGKVICIDAGHGFSDKVFKPEAIAPDSTEMKSATDTGTKGISTGVPEYKLNLSVSVLLKSKLSELGAVVVMTRESNNTDLGNIARAEIANACNADLFLRIHADGSEDSGIKGISVLYPGNKYIKSASMLNNSKYAADKVLKAIVASTRGTSRGIVARNDLTGFNWAKVPSILVEMGFMTNPEEDRKMNSKDYQEKIASGIIQGLESYFKNK